jgi:hypothetical protein
VMMNLGCKNYVVVIFDKTLCNLKNSDQHNNLIICEDFLVLKSFFLYSFLTITTQTLTYRFFQLKSISSADLTENTFENKSLRSRYSGWL